MEQLVTRVFKTNAILIASYLIYFAFSVVKKLMGDKSVLDMVRYRAPLLSALFLLLAGYDYLTLKTGVLTQPFVPCLNYIINIAWVDRAYLLECTLHTLRLLFLGYFIGVALGLVTGITCGYSEKVRYWVNPIIKFLGPIPTSTWIPIVMVVASSLFKGAVFIIALGSWFAVTVASMTGISNVDKDFFDAARTLEPAFRREEVNSVDYVPINQREIYRPCDFMDKYLRRRRTMYYEMDESKASGGSGNGGGDVPVSGSMRDDAGRTRE